MNSCIFVFLICLITGVASFAEHGCRSFSWQSYRNPYFIKCNILNAVVGDNWRKNGIGVETVVGTEISDLPVHPEGLDDFDEDENDEEDRKEHPNEPSWYEMFPKISDAEYSKLVELQGIPDLSKLPPNDPIFLDLPWPTRAGPDATAFGKHMQWRRQLTDGERLRWQKWAVYKRMSDSKDIFKYSLDDFIFQNMLKDVDQRCSESISKNDYVKALLWRGIGKKYRDDEEKQIEGLMNSYYASFNRKNFDDVKLLWLPSDDVELTLPGFDTATGHSDVNRFYRNLIKDLKYIGKVSQRIVSIETFGYYAVVKTLESVGQGSYLKIAKKRIQKSGNIYSPKETTPVSPTMIATTVLRKWNKQWRIINHQVSPFKFSDYTGNAKSYSMSKSKSRTTETSVPAAEKSLPGAPVAAQRFSEISKVLLEGKKIRVSDDGAMYLENSSRTGDIGKASSSQEIGKGSNVINDDVGSNPLAIAIEKLRESSSSELSSGTSNALGDKEIAKTVSDVNYFESDNKIAVGKDIAGSINFEASITKQCVQSLLYLCSVDRITKDAKDRLMLDLIDKFADEEVSLVETAYDLLLVKSCAGKVVDASMFETSTKQSPNYYHFLRECLEEFACQCDSIFEKLILEDFSNDDDADDDEHDYDEEDDDIDVDDKTSPDSNIPKKNSSRKRLNYPSTSTTKLSKYQDQGEEKASLAELSSKDLIIKDTGKADKMVGKNTRGSTKQESSEQKKIPIASAALIKRASVKNKSLPSTSLSKVKQAKVKKPDITSSGSGSETTSSVNSVQEDPAIEAGSVSGEGEITALNDSTTPKNNSEV